MRKFFKRLLWGQTAKRFSAWQVELTTRCPLRCRMCVRTGCSEWRHETMPVEKFRTLLPYLGDVETVVLEGWGESLLHPDLEECVRLVKGAGAQVGFVTSGSGLTEDRLRWLVDSGLDFIGFSIAGVTRGTHNSIRVNSDLADLARAIGWAAEISKRQPGGRPKVHVIFLMLKDNVAEMPDVPRFASELGVNEVVVLNIVQVTDEAQEAQRVFACDVRASPYEALLRETGENGRRLGVKLTHPSLVPSEVAVCDENPLRNLYVSSSGEVSPCVYLYPPVPSPFPRIFCGREYATEKITFGNVFTQPFEAIWENPSYVAFRERFTRRKQAFERAYGALLSGGRPEMAGPLPDPPEPCTTCHKMKGF